MAVPAALQGVPMLLPGLHLFAAATVKLFLLTTEPPARTKGDFRASYLNAIYLNTVLNKAGFCEALANAGKATATKTYLETGLHIHR